MVREHLECWQKAGRAGASQVQGFSQWLKLGTGLPNALDIPSYDLNLTVTNCTTDPAVFDDGFESGDTSMWSGSVP